MTNRVVEIIARRKSGAVVARWPLAPGENIFGASSGSDLRLETPGVSRKHARIVVREGEVLIEDLGSRFGTRRGGKLLEGPVPFTVKSPVEIGDVRLEAEPLIARPF
jgi:pSer/pThr/pTyr-binding forkhead associated (FHA) protein